MSRYILKRLFQALVVFFFLSFVCFALMALMPGDPVDLMIQSNPRITAEDVQRLKTLYGLDLPIYRRYLNWFFEFIQGNLGYSRTYRIPVTEVLGERLANTFFLSIASMTLSLLIAVPLGVLAAQRAGSKLDTFLNLIAFAGQSLPPFWIGIVSILIFSVSLQWLPASGTETLNSGYTGFRYLLDRLQYAAMPIAVFTFSQIPTYLRFVRGTMLEVLKSDYIRTAKAKGLSHRQVIWNHAFRNALIPVVTLIALGLSGVFSGAVITESVFAYQGTGKLIYDSVIGNDFNVAMVSFCITVAMVLLMNLVADLSYALLDPRISYK